jgi:hypothetical protein
MSKEFNPKEVIEIPRKSKIGAYVAVESYDNFKAMMEATENIADTFGDIDRTIAQKLEVAKDIKRVVDLTQRPLKEANERLRGWLAEWMHDNNIKKIEGREVKSVTLQESKTTKGAILHEQIKVGTTYKDISELSKDDLVEMLKNLGVKTRTRTEEVETNKPASIRIQK